MKKLKDRVKEAIDIAQKCPDDLRQICFEILLKYFLAAETSVGPSFSQDDSKKKNGHKPDSLSNVDDTAKDQGDLSKTDLHVKVRRFLDKYSLTVQHLNQLFYTVDSTVRALYDDLKTTRGSESQIRIALLLCLHAAIQTGDFKTTVEAAREEAKNRKCYDSANWATYFTKRASLFDFDKYSRDVNTITLSEEGKKELANVVKELQ